MLTQLRLDLLKQPNGLVDRARRAMVEKMFGGLYPAAVHVSMVKTRLDRSSFTRFRLSSARPSQEWSRAELELISAFVSARNGCLF